jgi:SAM-dependent methyltransferase
MDAKREDAYYTHAETVERLDGWYRSEKEAAFIDFILRDLKVPSELPVVEIGAGTGLHGVEMRRHFGNRYMHTDLSLPLVERARSKGLQSQVVDGLATPFPDAAVGCLLFVGTSTLIRDQAVRFTQFRECGRILGPGGVCIMVTPTLARLRNQHCLDRVDFRALAEHGLEVTARLRWSVVPGRFWSNRHKRLLEWLETMCSAVGLGARQIVVARKRPD